MINLKMMANFFLIVMLSLSYGCTKDKNESFKKSYNYYVATIKDNNKSVLIKESEIDDFYSQDNYVISLPQAMDFWGYSEFAIKYNLSINRLDKINDILKNKCYSEINVNTLKEKYIKDNLVYSLKACNYAVIPQIKYNEFYNEELNFEDLKVYILDTGTSLIFEDEYISEKQKEYKEHGHSTGFFLNKKEGDVIYWLIAW